MLDTVYYWTGFAVLNGLLCLVALAILIFIYLHLAVGLTYVHTLIKALDTYPTQAVMADKYRNRRFWRLRTYLNVVLSPRLTLSIQGTTLRSNWYTLDATGWVIRGHVHTFDTDTDDEAYHEE